MLMRAVASPAFVRSHVETSLVENREAFWLRRASLRMPLYQIERATQLSSGLNPTRSLSVLPSPLRARSAQQGVQRSEQGDRPEEEGERSCISLSCGCVRRRRRCLEAGRQRVPPLSLVASAAYGSECVSSLRSHRTAGWRECRRAHCQEPRARQEDKGGAGECFCRPSSPSVAPPCRDPSRPTVGAPPRENCRSSGQLLCSPSTSAFPRSARQPFLSVPVWPSSSGLPPPQCTHSPTSRPLAHRRPRRLPRPS